MSNLAEIRDAITKLPGKDRRELTVWLQDLDEEEMTPEEEAALFKTLDKAIAQADAGKCVPLEDVRKMIPSWITK